MSKIPFPSDIPFSMQEMRDEFERMLDRVWHSGLSTAPLDGQDWAPRLDVYDQPDGYHVRVEVPGLRADDVEVSILGNVLTIKGTKVMPEQSGEAVRRFPFGSVPGASVSVAPSCPTAGMTPREQSPAHCAP